MSVWPWACKRGRRRDDDEKSHQVRERHAEIGVDPDPLEFAWRLPWRLLQRSRFGSFLFIFNLFSGLPEEQVGTNGGAQDCDHHSDIVAGE